MDAPDSVQIAVQFIFSGLRKYLVWLDTRVDTSVWIPAADLDAAIFCQAFTHHSLARGTT